MPENSGPTPKTWTEVFADPRLPFAWDLTNLPAAGVGSAISGVVSQVANEKFPDIADLFPFRHGMNSKVFVAGDCVYASVASSHGVRQAAEFTLVEIEELATAASALPTTHDDLARALPAKWFSAERFTYVGPYLESRGCWPHLLLHLDRWLSVVVNPRLLSLNQQRVQRAIPPPPIIDAPKILAAMWILESEDLQGTAFNLTEVGTISCAHTIRPHLEAFRPNRPEKRFSVSVLRSNETLDLAVISIQGADIGPTLDRGNSDGLALMDHVTVAGFPNYRIGDSGHVAPGIITGFRPVSGIHRMLTNALIVSGTSGGPVLSRDGKVIGVAVTGADQIISAPQTENHGIIPIDALNYLGSSGPSPTKLPVKVD
jgi:hypothetical protein